MRTSLESMYFNFKNSIYKYQIKWNVWGPWPKQNTQFFLTQLKCLTTSWYSGILNFWALTGTTSNGLSITLAKLNKHMSSKCDGASSRRVTEPTFGIRQRTLRESTEPFSSTKKHFMILQTNSWLAHFVLHTTAYHFIKTDSTATGGINNFQVALNTLIRSKSSSILLLSLLDSFSISQESESLSSKSVLS